METPEQRRLVRLASVLAVLSTVAYVAVSLHTPVLILGDAPHDDGLFWRQAESIVAGRWLGAYDQFTLMKGAGYSLFLAANHVLGTPVTLAHSLLYAVACAVLAGSLFRLTASRFIAFALFLALLWHPAALSWERVVRDDVGAAQVLLVLACCLRFLLAPSTRGSRLRWAAGGGSLLVWLLMTREDGVWLLPGLVLLFGAGALRARASGLGFGTFLAPLVVFFGVTLVVSSVVPAINYVVYGRFEGVDFTASPFKRAVQAIQRVRVGEPVAHVAVPEMTRRAIYSVSPAFASLENHIEGPGRGWFFFGCTTIQVCDDYVGGWFHWELRDAAASVGAYQSSTEAAAFYERLAAEVNAACSDGRLTCAASALGFLPAVTREQWASALARTKAAVSLLAWNIEAPGVGHPPPPNWVVEQRMWRFLGRPSKSAATPGVARFLAGWFVPPDDSWIQLRCPGEPANAALITRLPSADLASHFPRQEVEKARFAFAGPDSCVLEITSPSGAKPVVALSEIRAAPFHLTPRGDLHFDHVATTTECCEIPPAVRSIRSTISNLYRRFLGSFAAAGLVVYLWQAWMTIRRRAFDCVFALATTAWVLLVCRVAILVLVDLSAFPAINVQYMQPAFPLLVLAAMASLVLPFVRNHAVPDSPEDSTRGTIPR